MIIDENDLNAVNCKDRNITLDKLENNNQFDELLNNIDRKDTILLQENFKDQENIYDQDIIDFENTNNQDVEFENISQHDENDQDFDDIQSDIDDDDDIIDSHSDGENIINDSLLDHELDPQLDDELDPSFDNKDTENSTENQQDLKARDDKFRLKSEWERICEKYGKDFEAVSDVVDLVTGEVVVDKGCIKKLKVTGIGSMVNEVDLKGVDEAWAQPQVQQKFMESQAQPLLSLSVELTTKENDDLISYDCRKTVHKDPFESEEEDPSQNKLDRHNNNQPNRYQSNYNQDYLDGDWCYDDDRYDIDPYHDDVMSSPGVYTTMPAIYDEYDVRSEPIFHDTEYELVDYVDVYEPMFVQPVTVSVPATVPVYYEEYQHPHLEEYRGGFKGHSTDAGTRHNVVKYENSHGIQRENLHNVQDHKSSPRFNPENSGRETGQSKGKPKVKKYQSPIANPQFLKPKVEISKQEEVSSEDDLLL